MDVQPTKKSETLGERLKKRRESLGLSQEEASIEIQSPVRYIQAFEDDDYTVFSAKVYALGFLKKMLAALSIKDTASFSSEFNREWEVQRSRRRPEITPLPENRGARIYLTPFRAGAAALVVFGLLIIAFFGYRFSHFLLSPSISIVEPHDRSEVSGPAVHIKGNTEKESRLTVNGREVNISEQGEYDEWFEVGAGINTLEFVVADRFGKTARKVRYILVK